MNCKTAVGRCGVRGAVVQISVNFLPTHGFGLRADIASYVKEGFVVKANPACHLHGIEGGGRPLTCTGLRVVGVKGISGSSGSGNGGDRGPIKGSGRARIGGSDGTGVRSEPIPAPTRGPD